METRLKYGSTIPVASCCQELLTRANNGWTDRDFVCDVGDWAVDYSDNGYVPMRNYRGYGSRCYLGIK